MYKSIKQINTGLPAVDGAGVHLVRVLGYNDTKAYDPFLMLDAFDSHNPADYVKGFPWHPHRGIETITYLIEGEILHADSLGNQGRIGPGEAQWMTAGSGIIHQEMPQPSGRMLGVQLWLNLPRSAKMTEPAYGDIRSGQVPVYTEPGLQLRVIAGQCKGIAGAFQGRHVSADFYDLSLDEGSVFELDIPEDETVFAYLVFGKTTFAPDNKQGLAPKQAVLFGEGRRLFIKALSGASRLLIFKARPLGEPIAWGGPVVMNTEAELRTAFAEMDRGDFIRQKPAD